MPAAEGADEGRHEGVVGDAVPASQRRAIAGLEARGVEDRRVDAVRVRDDATFVDAALEQLVPEHVRDGHDDVRVAQQDQLGLLGEALVTEAAAPVPRDPDLGAVVLDDERHAQRP